MKPGQPASGAASVPRRQAMTQLVAGIGADLAAYESLLQLLEQQFEAALHHHSARLATLADDIGTLVGQLQARRRQRLQLACQLAGADADMAAIFALLKGDSRDELERRWHALELMVLECKRRNERNSALLTEQYSIMRRVLQGEEQIYAPR
jgi:flagella synthesis protein FlgN